MVSDRIELLAPAKDLECGIAAINCGADAVYIGGPGFGAREGASNAVEDIEVLVRYAHKFWAKVYVTINTLLYDDEIPAALRLIERLYRIGVDGIMIQDVGLLECDLPPIPLIASTQMHNDSPEKVSFLERLGFQRVILARELDLEQIKAVRRAAKNIELECFVHGALCVCYSGQCLLSYALGGRSGNRGRCAQPCRKRYTVVDSGNRVIVDPCHILSLLDLNLSNHLRELIEAGVSAFKIEGRLKDKIYTANVVSYYRQRLDAVLSDTGLRKSSSGASRVDFTPDPDKTFNRGYTTYFLHGRNAEVAQTKTPKMLGEKIGPVLSLDRHSATINTNKSLHPGDGICFFDHAGELQGTLINSVDGNTIVPDKMEGIRKGTVIYRNHDHEFLSKVAKSRTERRISVALTLRESSDGLRLLAVDEDNIQAEFSIQCPITPAEKPEQAISTIQKQTAKTGDSDFVCASVEINLPDPIFLPISTINNLRRGVLERLTTARENSRPRSDRVVDRNDVPYPETELSYLGNVLNGKAEDFYKRHGVVKIEPAAESGLDMRGRKVMTCRYCIKYELGLCGKYLDQPKTDFAEPFYLIDDEADRLELRFNCTRCEMQIYLIRPG